MDGLKSVNLVQGELIINEGEAGEEFYIIEQGVVACLKLPTPNTATSDFIHVRDLTVGEHFGELALINNERRSLSIRVKSETCKVLRLDRDAFVRILGSIEQNLNKDYKRRKVVAKFSTENKNPLPALLVSPRMTTELKSTE